VLLAVLVAFLWQGFLTQTHRHYGPDAAPAATTSKVEVASLQSPGGQSKSELPADCPLCREVAHAGQFLLPGPIEFAVPLQTAFWLAVPKQLVPAPTRRSHAWQSRAPPSRLHA